MMMAEQPKKPVASVPQAHGHPDLKPNSVPWYFFEFWPIMVFGACFVLMMAVPLTLSGAFGEADVFSSSDSVWAPYGILIIGAFLMAWLVTFIAPWAMGAYVFVLGLYALVLVENVTATHWGWMIAILFLGYMFLGNIYFGNVYVAAKEDKEVVKNR